LIKTYIKKILQRWTNGICSQFYKNINWMKVKANV